MADYSLIVLFVLAVIVFTVREYQHGKRYQRLITSRRKLIREIQIKIVFNPFKEKHTWTIFNPRTRTWEWSREATPDEVEQYSDVVFPQKQGMEIINSLVVPAYEPFHEPHEAQPFENQFQDTTCKQCGFPVDDKIMHPDKNNLMEIDNG